MKFNKKHLKRNLTLLNMNREKKIFTLENVKLAMMGLDTIVYIPRPLIKHKVLDPKNRSKK